MSRTRLTGVVLVVLLGSACDRRESSATAATSDSAGAAVIPAAPPAPALSRADFNRYALRLDQPLYWTHDANGDLAPSPGEVKTLLFYPTSPSPDVPHGIQMVKAFDPAATPPGLSADEAKRRALVAQDLDEGALALVYTDLRAASAADKAFFRHMLAASRSIDELYATMRGMSTLRPRLATDDLASRSLFRRDWGPKCVGPQTRGDAACSAIAGAPRAVEDEYPAALQADKDFCATLEKRPDARGVMTDHFGVVREKDGKLVSVPYTEAYAVPMKAIADELRAAAADETDPAEAALKAYLEAAATSFTTNDWGPADEAWSRMNAQDSRWYLRIAPDEVLTDPCSLKAQFHLTLARIDPGSVAWQSRLTPLQDAMEHAVADLVGPPYVARKVTFHLPDFIQIVFNAGDDRAPMGGTAGESLPNWGKVESEGRGRTVAMTNIGTDPDSRGRNRKRIESLLDVPSLASWSDADEPGLVGTILHEATHNLGPTLTYAVQGKRGDAVFGGVLASMLEELKAETGAMFWLDWLAKKGVVSPELQRQAYTSWLDWALRHVSVGVHSGTDDQPYAQLAAIQVGFLLDDGALKYDAAAAAANGTDRGALHVDFARLPVGFERLFKAVLGLKAKNDKAGADALVAKYVDGTVVPIGTITERELRFPQTTYVYAVDR